MSNNFHVWWLSGFLVGLPVGVLVGMVFLVVVALRVTDKGNKK